jgi:hypothetical protein
MRQIATLKTDVLTATIGVPSKHAFSGQELGFFAKFALEAGWHTYGSPLPSEYTATSISFEDTLISRQSFRLPEAQQMPVALLGETLPVYSAEFEGSGTLLLKPPLPEGVTTLKGCLDVQQCSDRVCEPPLSIPFDITVNLEPSADTQNRPSVDT